MLGLVQTKIQIGRTTGGTITIEPVSDIKKCIVLVDSVASAYLESTSSLVVNVPAAIASYQNVATPVTWQVIELGGAVVE